MALIQQPTTSETMPSVDFNVRHPNGCMESQQHDAALPAVLFQTQPAQPQSSDDADAQVARADTEEEHIKVSENKESVQVTHEEDRTSEDLDEDPDIDPKILIREAMGSIPQPSLAQRREKARQRLMQSKAYAELIEDRLVDLEQQLRELSGKPQDLEETDNAEDEVPTISVAAALSWNDFSPWTEFDSKVIRGSWKHRMELNKDPKHIIEILKEEPRFRSFNIRTSHSIVDSAAQPPIHEVQDVNAAAMPQAQETSFHPHGIRIRSKILLKILKEVTGCYTTIGPYEHRLLLLRPFKLLVWFVDTLENKTKELEELHSGEGEAKNSRARFPIKETESKDASEQLRLLCDTINLYLGPQIKLRRGLDPTITKISFNDLWYIFKPGQEVRSPGDSQIQLYRVVKVTGGRKAWPTRTRSELHASRKLEEEGYSEGSFIVECFYFHFDGKRFGPVNATFQIRKYEGEKSIKLLPIVPLECYENSSDLRENLKERGEKFAKLSNPKTTAHRKYKGLSLDRNQEQIDSEVIIDFELAFIKKNDSRPTLGLEGRLVTDDVIGELPGSWASAACLMPGCCSNDVTFDDYQVDERARREFDYNAKFDANKEDARELEEDHKILLPPLVYGFVLRTRRWATFDIDLLQEPEYGDGWKQLVIDDHIKNQVLAMVKNHERAADSQARIGEAMTSVDLVQGKGRGLILLLHGEPGVGKTSTAECVAAQTKRPLFPITCGDIGDKAETVEANLEQSFQLAHKWGCVLLLDEADIFLSARTEQDIQRNAIVSVFLRTLEYYSGILFLTTNRVGKIDRAFKSRIHLSLLYKKLDKARTVQIWKNNISRVSNELASDGRRIQCDRTGILKFAKRHYVELEQSNDLIVWNGSNALMSRRQIRNAFQTAIAIAAFEQSTSESLEFEQVAQSAKEFDRYLKSVSHLNDSELNKRQGYRDDEYSEEDERKRRKKSKKRRKERQRDTASEEESSARSASDEDSDGDILPKEKKTKKQRT